MCAINTQVYYDMVSLHGHKTFYFLWHRRFTSAWRLDRLWGPPYFLSVGAGRRGLSTFTNIALVYKTFCSEAREILSNMCICMHLHCLQGTKEFKFHCC